MNYRTYAASIGIICLLALTACTAVKGHTVGYPDSTDGGVTTAATAQTTTEAAASAAVSKPALDFNPLTGLYNVSSGASVRPVCVMVGNDSRSRPQYGLDKADLYVEAETEGGITRIMAVFSGTSRVPDQLGPVRSARSPFVLIAQSLGAVYCHAGGSPLGLDTIKKTGISDFNALYSDASAAFWRDAAIKNTRGLEYSMMTGGQKLAARIKSLAYSASADNPSPFAFGNQTAVSGAGGSIQVSLSGNQTVSFRYQADSNLYYKSNGALSGGEPHLTADGAQLSVSNVLILYDEKYNESEKTISFRLNSGTGLFVSGGMSRPIKWSRTANSLKFTEDDGSALNAAPGKTYICLTDSANQSKTVVS